MTEEYRLMRKITGHANWEAPAQSTPVAEVRALSDKARDLGHPLNEQDVVDLYEAKRRCNIKIDGRMRIRFSGHKDASRNGEYIHHNDSEFQTFILDALYIVRGHELTPERIARFATFVDAYLDPVIRQQQVEQALIQSLQEQQSFIPTDALCIFLTDVMNFLDPNQFYDSERETRIHYFISLYGDPIGVNS